MAAKRMGMPAAHPRARTRVKKGRPASAAAGRRPRRGQVPIVGVGVGDLEGLRSFIATLPSRAGFAVVAIVDGQGFRDPAGPLPTAGPGAWQVSAAIGGIRPEANRVYVAPADRSLTIDGGLLRVNVPERGDVGPVALDRFFRSLAAARGEDAVGIILSGRGTAGTVGARRIRAAGGLVIVQAPDTAADGGMPRSAIGAGLADRICAPAQMPAALSAALRRRPDRATPSHGGRPSTLEAVLATVRLRTTRDFSCLTDDVVERGVRRRMRVHGLATLTAYLQRLRSRPDEADQLAADLRLADRSFFVPAAAWDELAATMALLVRRRDTDQPFRAWVPACATGEDAYAVAMILTEEMATVGVNRPIRIFATDLDAGALAHARAGLYPEGIALDVSPSRLGRFFSRSARGYTIVEWLRDMLVTGAHNLVVDPPFGKLDLVVCRGVLPDLQPEAQEKVVKRLHLALKPGGHLLVDAAAAMPALGRLFSPQSSAVGLYRRVDVEPGIQDSVAPRLRVARILQPARWRSELVAAKGRPPSAGRAGRSARRQGNVREEVACIDEELQVASKELASANDQLQMANEELSIVNAELRGKVGELTRLNDDIADVLASTDIAMVFLDADCRIRRFTSAATRVLKLRPGDQGRSIGDVGTTLPGVDLARAAREVVASRVVIEKEVDGEAGKRYFVRVLPHRTDERRPGAVVTILDITVLKDTEDQLRRTRDELRVVNATLEGRVTERTKWLALLHDVTRTIAYAPTAHEALRRVLRLVCVTQGWQVGLVYQPDPATPGTIVPTVSFVEGAQGPRAFFDLASRQRYADGASLPGRVFVDGKALWTDDERALAGLLPVRGEMAVRVGFRSAAALPIVFGQQTIAVLELFSRQQHAPSLELVRLMTDVSAQIGEVLERERATAQIADVVWQEQQALLHTLHDSLGQTLTGLGMLSSGLHHRLAGADAASAETAQQIARQAQVALEDVRKVSRGLFPLEIDPEGFVPALRELAATTASLHRVQVSVAGDDDLPVRDSRVLTQLYRIAQEAVTNAVKHARASAIRIRVGAAAGRVMLAVEDDGIGVDGDGAHGPGLGLRIMGHRAASIGATLSVNRGEGGGTQVTCTLPSLPALAAVGPA